jgi:hypothetical protein
LCFRVASFFIRDIFLSQRATGLIERLHSWLHFLSLIAFVECRARAASDFDISDLMVWGNGSLYCCFGVHGLRLIKNPTPSRASPVRKRVRATGKENHGPKFHGEGSFIAYETSAIIKCLNIKTMEVVHIPRMLQLLFLGGGLRGDEPLALFFL